MFSRAILTDHLWVPTLEVPNLAKTKSLLTVTPKYGEVPIQLWKNSKLGNFFGVPMYHYRFHDKVADKLTDGRSLGSKTSFKIRTAFRPGQEELMTQFSQYENQGMTGFIVQAPPGFGKTVIAINMIARLRRTALVVVPRSNLANQWVERFMEHTDLDRDEIGMAIGGNVSDWRDCKVVIALVHTLALDRFGVDFKKYFGTVVFDEVDRSVPPQTFAPVAAMFPSKYRIGVSATMTRQDGMETIFEKHVGQCFIRGADTNRMPPKVLIHEFSGYSGKVWAREAINARGQLLSRLAGNEQRTHLIAKYVKSIINSDRRVVVLSDRIAQLQAIKAILVMNGWADKQDVGFYVRRLPQENQRRGEKQKYKEMTSAERERVASACKVILATYGMFALGTDIPELAGLIYATPMSETQQSKGRVEREFAGKKQPVVVDIVDTAYDAAKRWGYKRERQYFKEGLKIKKIRG